MAILRYREIERSGKGAMPAQRSSFMLFHFTAEEHRNLVTKNKRPYKAGAVGACKSEIYSTGKPSLGPLFDVLASTRGIARRGPGRLLEEAQTLREQARMLPFGPVRDAAMKKAREAEAAAHMDDWLSSPELQPPKNNDTHGRD
jgi:hypothetical protein